MSIGARRVLRFQQLDHRVAAHEIADPLVRHDQDRGFPLPAIVRVIGFIRAF